MLQFECPSCKTKCETKPEFAGQQVPCPKCKASVTVPGNPRTPAQPKATESGPNLLAFGILALVVALLFVFVFAWLNSGAGGGPNPVVVMETSMGTVKMELYQDKAPITVKNFLQYVDDKHYDGTIFHRVIEGFMIQGGGFVPGLMQKSGGRLPIRNEADNGLSNSRGTVAMARTGDPNSATDQFYINVADNRNLDRNQGSAGYAVFGKVIDGMDVVDTIRVVPTGVQSGQKDVPVKNVLIKSIRRAEAN